MADISATVSAENLKLDDIGNSVVQLIGVVHVLDQAPIASLVTTGPESASLTEHVKLDDIGQGVAQLPGVIHVTDGPPIAVLSGGAAGTLTASVAENLRPQDADDSWAELTETEGFKVSESASGALVIGAVITASVSETLRLSDSVPVNAEIDPGGLAFPDEILLEFGFGGRLDEALITLANVVGAWALGQTQDLVTRDLTGHGHNGTYVGTFTRAIPGNQPEGNMGAEFTGTQKVVVPDDSGDPETLNLSASGGSIDLVLVFSTTQNDGVLRCIAGKMEGGSTGVGYFAAIQSGAIVACLRVAAGTVFNFSRALPGGVLFSDGLPHRVHLYYDPPSGQAILFGDGQQLGAAQATTNTDPEVNSEDFIIGMFSDDSGGFIGTIYEVSIGREGDLTLSAALEATTVWTNAIEDVRTSVMPITARRSIGTGVLDLVQKPGSLTFALDNSQSNSAATIGYYSPGHPSCRPGFSNRIAVRLRVIVSGEPHTLFRGFMSSATVIPNIVGERYVAVYCTDWMSTLARTSALLDVQIGQTADVVFGHIVDGARRPPPAVDIGASVITLPYALDSGDAQRDKLLSEAQRVAQSTGALIYQRGDGTLVYEPREQRQIGGTVVGSFVAMRDLDVEHSEDRVLNVIQATYIPRRLDPSTTLVLAKMEADETAQPITPGQTVVLQAPYRDPAQSGQRIGGKDVVSVINTDWTMNSSPNGSGTNLTSQFEVTVRPLGTVVRWTITNNSMTLGYITLLQARGQAIYIDKPVTFVETDETSIFKHDERELALSMDYEGTLSGAMSFAKLILGGYANLDGSVPIRASIVGCRSLAFLIHAVQRDMGHLITVAESVSGITATRSWYIHGVEHRIERVSAGALIAASWELAPSWPDALMVSFTGTVSGLHDLTFGGPLVLEPGTYTLIFNRTGDTVNVAGVAAGGGGGNGTADTVNSEGGGGGGGGSVNAVGETVVLVETTYTALVGAGGISGRPGATGGTTEFRRPSEVILQLLGGTGGHGEAGNNNGGIGGSPVFGAGFSGSNGGTGGREGVHGQQPGDVSANAAAGGGGGGISGAGGSSGGNGVDQGGGPGGNAGNDGTTASGQGGFSNNGTDPGGGGGGGGGSFVGGLGGRGGGGGGGSGGRTNNGDGGRGGDGILVITRVG